MGLYSPKIIEHYKNPRHVGKLREFTNRAEELNTACGDRIVVYLKIKDGKFLEITHETEGCAVTIASASVLAERLAGMGTEEVEKVNEKTVTEMLEAELTPSRVKCAMLPVMAIRKGLAL